MDFRRKINFLFLFLGILLLISLFILFPVVLLEEYILSLQLGEEMLGNLMLSFFLMIGLAPLLLITRYHFIRQWIHGLMDFMGILVVTSVAYIIIMIPFLIFLQPPLFKHNPDLALLTAFLGVIYIVFSVHDLGQIGWTE